MSQIHWSKTIKQQIRRKLLTNSPKDVCDSFKKMVESLLPPQRKMAMLEQENARLREMLANAMDKHVRPPVPAAFPDTAKGDVKPRHLKKVK